jgi:hypothetical protein
VAAALLPAVTLTTSLLRACIAALIPLQLSL